MKYLISFSLLLGFISFSTAQNANYQAIGAVKTVKISKATLKKLSKGEWTEIDRAYQTEVQLPTSSKKVKSSKMIFSPDGQYQQGAYKGTWSTQADQQLLLTLDATAVGKPGGETITRQFFIQKISKKELILVEGLDHEFRNVVTYHYRKT